MGAVMWKKISLLLVIIVSVYTTIACTNDITNNSSEEEIKSLQPTPPNSPFSTTTSKQQSVGYEQYFVKRELRGYDSNYQPIYSYSYMTLRTIGEWTKNSVDNPAPRYGMLSSKPTGYSWLIDVHVSSAPLVVNWSYEPKVFTALDPIGSKANCKAYVFTKNDFHNSRSFSELTFNNKGENRGVSDKNVNSIVLQETGDHVILLDTDNPDNIADWWVKIGVAQ